MLPFDEDFRTGDSKITQVRLSVVLASGTLLSLTEENVNLGGFTRDTSTTIDGQFTVGAAVTGKLTVSINNSDNAYSSYDFRGAVITAYLGGVLTDETEQLLPVGIYTVDGYTYDGNSITLTAYDNLYKFDKACKDTSVTFPQTIAQLITLACSVAGVTLANTAIPNGEFSIAEIPNQWSTMTWHDVISHCAQIACCYARILPDGRLYFSWYPEVPDDLASLDGGTYETATTPYSDGDTADGGDFTFSETDDYDGGVFGDRDLYHVLGSIFSMAIDTDDVLITGVSVVLDPADNVEATEDTEEYVKTIGAEGYIIRISANPLIETTSAADSVCAYLYNNLVGMRFRPLSASILENPAVEAGDSGYFVDRRNNNYKCILSHVTYTTSAATSITCDAESPKQNLQSRYTETEKTRALVQRTFEVAATSSTQAMQTIMSAVATTMGLYQYTQDDGQGGTIYVYGNKNTLEASNIRWRFSAGALMVSSDYGVTWNGALTSDGIAVLQEVYAVKVNADNILAGTLYGRTISGGEIYGAHISLGGQDNVEGELVLYNATGEIVGSLNSSGFAANGTFISYRTTDGYATKIESGRLYFYHSPTTYTYEQLLALGWSESYGAISSTAQAATASYGLAITTPKEYITIGRMSAINKIDKHGYVANFGGSYGGYSERNLFYSTSRFMNTVYLAGGLVLGTPPSTSDTYGVVWPGTGNDPAYIGFYEDSARFIMDTSNGSAGLRVTGDLTVNGTKNRAVNTEHYGTVGMNAFETAGSHFADVGSGTVGDTGTVTIFFDPVFAETVDQKAEYQVFLTRTSEAETSWVEKQNGFFTVHGDPGATFDWMIVGYQRDYVTNRMEQIDNEKPYISDEPIVTVNTSAIDEVERMVMQYNEQLEGLDHD